MQDNFLPSRQDSPAEQKKDAPAEQKKDAPAEQKQDTLPIQRNELLENFFSLLGNASQEPLPYKVLKRILPIVDKNFPPGNHMIEYGRYEFSMKVFMGLKNHWRPLDNKFLVWVVYKYTERHNGESTRRVQDLLNKDQIQWQNISAMLGITTDCAVNQWKILCPTSCKEIHWLPEEDEIIVQLAQNHLTRKCWKFMADCIFDKTQRQRFPKQIRGRWHNYLNPSVSKSHWEYEEDQQLLLQVRRHGKRWSKISQKMTGRNENMVKNRYNSLLQKMRKLTGSGAQNEDISDQVLLRLHSRYSKCTKAEVQSNQDFDNESDSNDDQTQKQELSDNNNQQTPLTVTKSIRKMNANFKQTQFIKPNPSQQMFFPQKLVKKIEDEEEQSSESSVYNDSSDSKNKITDTFQEISLQRCGQESKKTLTSINPNNTEFNFIRNSTQQFTTTGQGITGDLSDLAEHQKNLHHAVQSVTAQQTIEIQPLLLERENNIPITSLMLQSPPYQTLLAFSDNNVSLFDEKIFEEIFQDEKILFFL